MAWFALMYLPYFFKGSEEVCLQSFQMGNIKTNLRYPKIQEKSLELHQRSIKKYFQLGNAIGAENEKKIETVLKRRMQLTRVKGKIKFKIFMNQNGFLEYELGQTTRSNRAPSNVTISNTKDIFRSFQCLVNMQ